MKEDEFQYLPRGQQVHEDVLRRGPRDWLALDDDAEGWPAQHANQFIQTHMYEGISDPEVRSAIQTKLAVMCPTKLRKTKA